jgi:hypothetical protein
MTGSRNFERTPGLVQLARRQHAVVTRAQLAGVAISARHVASQLAARRWRAATSDVVVLHTGPLPREAELWVAVLDAEPPVALGSWTGLAKHGLRGWDREGTHIVVPRGANERPRREQLWDQLERVGQVRFRDLMRRSVADIRGGSDALSEIDFVRLCRRSGLPEPKRQEHRIDARRRHRFLDAEWILDDGRRLVVEIDGIGHMDASRWYDDLLRDAELDIGDGSIHLRLPASAARTEPERVLAILTRHLRSP